MEEKGLKGFQIDSRVLDRELADATFGPLYARLVALDVPLIILPSASSTAIGSRLLHARRTR